MPKLSQVDLIYFDTAQANKAFYEYLMTKSEGIGFETENDFMSLEGPSVESIVHELARLKWRET
jgi:hypothetical protein